MDLKNYFAEKKKLYELALLYLENNEKDNEELSFQNLIDQTTNQNILNNREEFDHFLQMLSKISHDHHRNSEFFNRIKKIIIYFINDIKKTYSKNELFDIFRDNMLILHFLIEQQMLLKESIYNLQFFWPEIKSEKVTIFDESLLEDDPNIFNNYQEKQKNGENDSYICSLIRNDAIEDFIAYTNRANLQLSSRIKFSIYETNQFLLRKEPSLIEYAAFFGSIQICQYLRLNNIELKPSLWLYAIHSNSAEMIHLLEENHVNAPNNNKFEICLEEAIKCHHNEIAAYIENNLIVLKKQNESDFKKTLCEFGFCYSNYSYISDNFNPFNTFFYLCKYNYNKLVDVYIEKRKNDLKQERFKYIIKKNYFC